MLDRWVFESAFFEMLFAVVIYGIVLWQQKRTLNSAGALRPLRRLLFTAILFLILGAVPLMIVYADILWFNRGSVWIVNLAVLANAGSKAVEGIVLLLIWRFGRGFDG